MDYETAKELFDYDPDTGRLTWMVRASRRSKIGDVAGSLETQGYRQVKFKGKEYKVHRVIWLITYGAWPEKGIDHINGIRDDNRLINLREANQSENSQNRKAYSNTGVSGVTLTKKGYYRAKLIINGRRVLGTTFKNFEAAVAAVTEAKKKYHTFNPDMVAR